MKLRNETNSDTLHYLKYVISVNRAHSCPTVYVSVFDDTVIVNMLQFEVDVNDYAIHRCYTL